MIILGIDPGVERVGFGVINYEKGKTDFLDCGIIETSKDKEHCERLLEIQQDLDELIKEFKPGILAVERLYFSKNVKTATAVGEARGVILAGATKNKIKIVEFNPSEIKIAVCGIGDAKKPQVQEMVKNILKLKAIPKPDDAADGLAIALCAANSNIR